MKIQWLGHASFKIKSKEVVIYIDPYAGEEGYYLEKADIILISHFHYDHCSLEKIRKISTEETMIWGTKEVASEIHGCIVLIPGQPISTMGIKVTAVPAYNTAKRFHPRGFAIGFLIEIEKKIIYFISDSDVIPEMVKIKADILLIPVGGTYTMNAREAVKVVQDIKPRVAIPMHYGSVVGNIDDAELFKELAETDETEVTILSPSMELEI